MAQRIPLPLTVSCFSKIQIGFTFLVPAYLGSPGQRAVKRVYVYCLFISHASPLILFSTLFLTYLFWLVNACFCCVRFSFFHASPRDWLGKLSPKWPILCRVGCKTTTQSMNQSLICRSRDTTRSVAAYSTCPWFLRSSARLYLPVSSDAGDGRYNIHVTLLLL